MKYLIILGDGMSDEPIDELDGKTPLQYANTPAMDEVARMGKCGHLQSVPDNFPPGSEIANLTVLGYDCNKVFEGRGSLEAASMGVELKPGDLALRCNLITIENDAIKNHSAGHISDEEANVLVDFLNKEICPPNVVIHAGVSYRHLMVIKGGVKTMKCTPPHDVPGQAFRSVLPVGKDDAGRETADLITDLIFKSQEALKHHPVNVKRKKEGKEVASSIWPWSPGYKPKMETVKERYGLQKSAVISAVDLIRGIGVYAGMEVIYVEGATGLYNTNYEGKAQAAIDALKTNDFVFLHVEATDEAGHEGDVDLKVKTIEYLDKRIVKTIWDEVSGWDEAVTIAILPDHPTPCRLKVHTRDDVPFIIYKPGETPDDVTKYDEFSVRKGAYGRLVEAEFMKTFLA